jgi:hypothetical protein
VVHGLRVEYQDRINFVVWDYDSREDRSFAGDLGVARHPAFAIVAPDSTEVEERRFGPLVEEALRALLDDAIARHGG